MTALSFSLVEENLPKWVEGLAPDTFCEWLEKPRKHFRGANNNGQKIDIRLVSLVGVGTDDEVHTFNSGACAGSEIERCVVGIRALTVQLEATSRRQGLSGSGGAILSAIEGAAVGEASMDELAEMGLAPQSFGRLGMVPETHDGRVRLRWSLPVTFGATQAIATPSTGYIDNVTTAGTLNAPGDLGISVITAA